MRKTVLSFALLLAAMTAAALDKDSHGYYILGSANDWRDFAALVQTTPQVNAKMTADINLGNDQTMVGTEASPFQGIFNGQGHSLTVNYEASENGIAPFRYVKNATIGALHVKGSIHTTGMAIGGIAGTDVADSDNSGSSIRQCWVSALLSVDVVWGSLQNSIGGIFLTPYADAVIEDCLFDGKFDDKNDHWNGGFVNHCSTVTIRNSLNLGTFPAGNDCGTFNRLDCKLENCYFLNAYGREQGTQVTEAQLADGTVTNALQAGRSDDFWVQDAATKRPMLKVFAGTNPDDPTPGGGDGAIDEFICKLMNGTIITWKLNEQPKVELTDGKFSISSTRATVYYEAMDVANFTLGRSGDSSGIEDIKAASADRATVSREGGQLLFSGCKAGETVTAYDAGGREVVRLRADADGRLQLSLSQLQPGIYIVKSESVTLKIAKK